MSEQYVALYCDCWLACYPERAEEECIKALGTEKYDNMTAGESAIWLGNWLMKHRNEFEKYTGNVQPGHIYQVDGYLNSNGFCWPDTDKDYPNTCHVVVEEVPKGAKWTIVTGNEYDSERLVVFDDPDETGFMRQKHRWER